jgi:uncharacterized protein (DUF302 family)
MTPSLITAARRSAATCGFPCVISDKDFATAVARVTEALEVEGFGVETEIDVKAAVKAKPDIGRLLPGHVVIREASDGGLDVGFMDPLAALQMTGNPEVAQVAHEVQARLQCVKARLSRSTTISSGGPR